MVAEEINRLDFYDRQSWQLIKSLTSPWSGIDHLDMSADGSYLLATTESAAAWSKWTQRPWRSSAACGWAVCPST